MNCATADYRDEKEKGGRVACTRCTHARTPSMPSCIIALRNSAAVHPRMAGAPAAIQSPHAALPSVHIRPRESSLHKWYPPDEIPLRLLVPVRRPADASRSSTVDRGNTTAVTREPPPDRDCDEAAPPWHSTDPDYKCFLSYRSNPRISSASTTTMRCFWQKSPTSLMARFEEEASE